MDSSNGTEQTTINPNGLSTEMKNNCVLPSISQDIVPQSSNQEYINEEILHNANGNKQDIIYQKNITVENLTSNYVVVGVINKCAINTVGEEINVPLNVDVCGIHNYHLPTTVQTEKDTMARKDSTIKDAKEDFLENNVECKVTGCIPDTSY
ncbi:hypothetical protein NQ317_010065 [Molorchus minor]|uniref:Uncharacterized protein n=1 Tax=Molorchus minor TaxID=1323400 RepID=A0ABQ9JMG0_9CUCU|nr:hypothetical protein NQ317_010065 [Molorchus minor]